MQYSQKVEGLRWEPTIYNLKCPSPVHKKHNTTSLVCRYNTVASAYVAYSKIHVCSSGNVVGNVVGFYTAEFICVVSTINQVVVKRQSLTNVFLVAA